jgi:hypothetical protein
MIYYKKKAAFRGASSQATPHDRKIKKTNVYMWREEYARAIGGSLPGADAAKIRSNVPMVTDDGPFERRPSTTRTTRV